MKIFKSDKKPQTASARVTDKSAAVSGLPAAKKPIKYGKKTKPNKTTVFVGELPPGEAAKVQPDAFGTAAGKSPLFDAIKTILYNWQYILAFFIPAGILFIAYLCFGVYPASDNSVLSLDLNAQYVYYYDYMYDVFAGRESLFYSWSRNLSGEFIGIIGYYLASPFSFIVWLFPRVHITEGLLVMILAKVGAIGVTTAVYLYRGRGYRKSTAVIFSMMYALCSYVIVQTMNPMWLDGVMALPLVMYGIEQLVRKGRFRLLIVSLVYSFVTCFYIGYMVGIFAALYFCFYFFISRAYDRLYGVQILSRIGLFMVSSVSAVLSSCFMLIPVYNSLGQGKFSFSNPDYSIVENFILFDLFGKFLPNSYDTVRMEGVPFFYCGILTLIMAGCYFIGTSNPRDRKSINRARIANMFLILMLIAFMFVRPLDMFWHGGQMPNWLPYRYSFMVSLLLVVIAAESFNNIKYITKRQIAAVGGILFGITILLGKFDSYSESLSRDLLPELTVSAVSAVIIVIFSAYLIQTKEKLVYKKTYVLSNGNTPPMHTRSSGHGSPVNKAVIIVLAVLASGEIFYNTMTQILKQDEDIVYSTRNSYIEPITYLREKLDDIYQNDGGFFRVEKNFNRSANDPLALRMYGMTHSSSTLNERPISMLSEFGLTSRGHYTKYTGATPMIDDLFGVKYILSCPNDEYSRVTGPEDISVEYNFDAMPIAYLTDPLLLNFYFSEHLPDKDNAFAKQNRLMSNMLGDEKVNEYIKTIPNTQLRLETENVSESSASRHSLYTVIQHGKNAQLKYTAKAPAEGEFFLWMPSDYERKLNVWVNQDIWKGNYYETENYNIKSLGSFKKGEEFSVTLTLTTDRVYFKDIFFGYFDVDLYARDYTRLRDMNENTMVQKLSSTSLTVNSDYPEERLLFTTIPIEAGWKIKVDGRATEPQTVLDSLMGIMLEPGAHVIELEYSVPDYTLALGLTATGILLFSLMCIISWRMKKRYGEVDYGLPADSSFESDEDIFEESLEDTKEKINEIYNDLMQINTKSPQDTSELNSGELLASDEAQGLAIDSIKDEPVFIEDTKESSFIEEPITETQVELEEPDTESLNPADIIEAPKTIIPYKEVSKPALPSRLDSYEASAEDLFPQKAINDIIDKNKNKE